jgi:hypothetical protein|tara:strand:+ start:281 stop:475 length:195 start_codon:yes stop_codon:yes gene_type:complete
MKWFLVVYFFVCCGPEGGWKTAEELNNDGWYRIEHPDAESCINAQWEFTEVTNTNVIRASCEQH